MHNEGSKNLVSVQIKQLLSIKVEVVLGFDRSTLFL